MKPEYLKEYRAFADRINSATDKEINEALAEILRKERERAQPWWNGRLWRVVDEA